MKMTFEDELFKKGWDKRARDGSSYSKARGDYKRARDGTELESVESNAFEDELFIEAVEGFRLLRRDGELGDSV